ncbi:mediator of RNA polymerase II transcription subunit 11 isoform X2 [Catharus ustulatus]|uniref:mediator of RNA polymerase II transcription subunit 11 isoform X2 n=1 Tax=Catharus ustulatus TaxID=91951 RepID=UPI00140D5452|nr:mediator of RNA polymerase II transcription subunit 11 isoform X2 [Catharus ustulatus]
MAGFGVANERLRALEELEREIGASLQSAGSVILELSKEKPQERHLDRQAAQFGAAVAKVEAELSAQIRYLTQVGIFWAPSYFVLPGEFHPLRCVSHLPR